jgi:hypothetical protein
MFAVVLAYCAVQVRAPADRLVESVEPARDTAPPPAPKSRRRLWIAAGLAAVLVAAAVTVGVVLWGAVRRRAISRRR